jgi:hypothetical protein
MLYSCKSNADACAVCRTTYMDNFPHSKSFMLLSVSVNLLEGQYMSKPSGTCEEET